MSILRSQPGKLARLLVTVIIFTVGLAASPGRAQNPGKPLSKDDVVGLLKGGVPSGRVDDVVRQNGINFELTPDAEAEIRSAGGADELLATLRELSQKVTRTLIETSPHALVYCDETYEGQADSQGQLAVTTLKPGSHSLKVSLAGMRDFENTFTVSPGQTTTVMATLAGMGAASGSLRTIATLQLPASAGYGVDVDPNTNKVFASGGASAGQQVVMIDGATNRVVATLGTGSGAHVNPQTGKVYAGNVYGGGIAVYSAGDGHLIATVGAYGCPVEAVVDPSRNQIWGGAQCGANDDPVFRIDGSRDQLTSKEIGSGGVMGSILVNPATHVVYVFAGAGGEGKIDPNNLVRTKAPFTTMVTAVDPVANRLYGAAASGNGVEIVDGATERVLGMLPISHPGPIAVNSSNHRIYVVDNSASPPQLKVFDGAANSLPMLGSLSLASGGSSTALAVNTRSGRIYRLVQNGGIPSLEVIEDGL